MAKLHKTAAMPANTVLAPEKKKNSGASSAGGEEEADKTPIAMDEDEDSEGHQGQRTKKDDFSVFDDEEDQKYIDRGKRNAMRRRGLDPRALDRQASKEAEWQGKRGEENLLAVVM